MQKNIETVKPNANTILWIYQYKQIIPTTIHIGDIQQKLNTKMNEIV